MLSFDNTAIAFSTKNNSDLKRSYWLFKMVASQSVVNFAKTATDLAIKLHIPISWIIKPTIFKQFCGGEPITECNAAIKLLANSKVKTILDYSIEGKVLESDFDATAEELIKTIQRAKGDANIPYSVFKVTGIGKIEILEKANNGEEKLNADEKAQLYRIKDRVNKICKAGFDNDVPVLIDAEESWIQNTIDRMTDDMMKAYNKTRPLVYNTFQLYRWDRLDFLKSSFEKAQSEGYYLGAKLVRGAYMEKERERAELYGYKSPIQPDKEASDKDYDKALEFCIKNIDRIGLCAGSHNENSAFCLVKLMSDGSIAKNHKNIFFSQLLGMSDHISYNLANEGYNVCKYMPYGPVKEVLPYLIRRAQENTSVKGQTGRELSLILKEQERRKHS